MIFDMVKSLADEKHLSIREVERQAGLENGTIGKWRNAIPRFDSIIAVANVLGVSVNEFAEIVTK